MQTQNDIATEETVPSKAKRASIQVAGVEIEAFQLPNGDYAMSQTQTAQSVEKCESSVRRFLTQNGLKASDNSSFQSAEIMIEKDWEGQGNNQAIKAIPVDVVVEYWLSQAFKGNTKAQSLVAACMQEALERRCDTAFNQTKSEQKYEQQTTANRERWDARRKYLREQHTNFEYACKTYGFSCASTHNKLTMAAVHKTARELKELEVIQGNKDVGLNYIEDSDELLLVAKVKRHFSRYRKGCVDERIHRALKEARKEKDTLCSSIGG